MTNKKRHRGGAAPELAITREQLLSWKAQGMLPQHDYCDCGHSRAEHRMATIAYNNGEPGGGECSLCKKCSRGFFTFREWK